MLTLDVEKTIIDMVPARGPICAVNRLWNNLTTIRMTHAVTKIQRWYRYRRLEEDHILHTPVTRWTLTRYFITKFNTRMLDILCCGLMFIGWGEVT